MQPFSPEVIAAAKARYAQLKAAGQSATGDFARRVKNVPAEAPPLADDAILFEDTIPGGWYWHGTLRRGEGLRLVNGGTLGVPILIWNGDEPTERLNPADTLKIQWTARISTGRVLLSDMGRALASVTFDGFGFSDGLAGCSTASSERGRFGEAAGFNARDHFLKAAAKYGLGKRDVGPCISLFAPVVADADDQLSWDQAHDPTGAVVDLRAEMNLIVAVANCPHPLAPLERFEAAPLRIAHFRAPPPPPDDLARTGTQEARRAFQNTDHLFGVGRRVS